MWFAVAIVAFSLAAAFDYRWLRTFSWLLYLVNLGLLLLTLAIGVDDQRRPALGFASSACSSSSPRYPKSS